MMWEKQMYNKQRSWIITHGWKSRGRFSRFNLPTQRKLYMTYVRRKVLHGISKSTWAGNQYIRKRIATTLEKTIRAQYYVLKWNSRYNLKMITK